MGLLNFIAYTLGKTSSGCLGVRGGFVGCVLAAGACWLISEPTEVSLILSFSHALL